MANLFLYRKLDNVQMVTAETRIEENRQRILDVSQEFVDRFTDPENVRKMPKVIRLSWYICILYNFYLFLFIFRAIAAYTAQHAQRTFPDTVLSYLSGFIILR